MPFYINKNMCPQGHIQKIMLRSDDLYCICMVPNEITNFIIEDDDQYGVLKYNRKDLNYATATIYLDINYKKCIDCQNMIEKLAECLECESERTLKIEKMKSNNFEQKIEKRLDEIENMIKFLPMISDEYKNAENNFNTFVSEQNEQKSI